METSDVVIVGAGPAAAVSAKRFAEAGFSVVCLEQGEWPDYGKARGHRADFELDPGREWAWNPNKRQSSGDYPVDDTDSDIAALMYNAVGGGTVVYAAQWHRLLPSDFRVRTLDGVADDWPLTYHDLVPFYQRVERDFGVSGLAGDPAFPKGDGPPLPPVPLGAFGRRIAQAHNRLGWHWWPATNAIATRPHGQLNACVRRATCLWGCQDGAKGSVDRTHWPTNTQLGVTLITGAHVRQVTLDQHGRANGVVWIDSHGKEHEHRAGVTILCANGIGTPRLLLLSATATHPDGLANRSGLVGKRLMMHPFSTVVGLFEEELQSWQGAWGQHLHSLEFYETDADRGFIRGAKWGLQPTGGLLAATRAFPWGDNPIWGEGFQDNLRKRFGHSAMWGIISEDLPDESNQVALDSNRLDPTGIPGVQVHYRMSENSRRMVAFHTARAKESLQEAGAYDVIVTPQVRESGWHLLGTCKMGTDPETSVVDADGRCHDVENLYIFDGSIWPTSSGMNPTATIAALALRCTEELIAQRRSVEVAA